MSIVLGIDTSNYTTSAALFDTESGKAVSEKKLLPVKQGERGLRQSDAVFHHTKQLPHLIQKLFNSRCNIEAVGYSYAPRCVTGSYMPCFLVGENTAVMAAVAANCDCYKTSHQVGHILSALFSCGRLELIKSDKPFLAFHVSGGTTDLLLCKGDKGNVISIEQIGGSDDLKAGQAVDRIGVLMGLGFPCGAELEKLAINSQKVFNPKVSVKGCSCSLSGLQNKCEKMLADGDEKADIAAFCIQFIYKSIHDMTVNAFEKYGDMPIVYAGGVMSDSIIRNKLDVDFNGYFAEPALSSDNAVGVAVYAAIKKGWI